MYLEESINSALKMVRCVFFIDNDKFLVRILIVFFRFFIFIVYFLYDFSFFVVFL